MSKAFSIIELIIVISIIVLLSVMAVPAFTVFGARADLDSKAEEIKIAVEKAAMAAKNPEQGKTGAKFLFDNTVTPPRIKSTYCKLKDTTRPQDGCLANFKDEFVTIPSNTTLDSFNTIYFSITGKTFPSTDVSITLSRTAGWPLTKLISRTITITPNPLKVTITE